MCAVPAAGEVALLQGPAAALLAIRSDAGYGIPAGSGKRNRLREPIPNSHRPERAASWSDYMALHKLSERSLFAAWTLRAAFGAALAVGLSACNTEPQTRGYVLDEKLLNEVRVGTDAQKVLSTMGSPSTVSTVGNQTWYYISQKTTRTLQFMEPTVVDQRVLAINFNKSMKVEKIASYGLQDGVVFDFISRTTPTGGNELSVVRQLLRATGQGVI
jgi:outer membrane protein assembly factor BamE (lipoprotein component of BamABCDE complex)